MISPAISLGLLMLIWTHAEADTHDPTVRGRLMLACANETGFELSDWSQLEDRHFTEPIPPAFKCFINCVYESHGVTRKGDVTPLQEVRMHLSLDEAQWQGEYDLLRRCGAAAAHDLTQPCERGWNIFKCSKVDEEKHRGLVH